MLPKANEPRHTIPLYYRLLFIYVDPLMALSMVPICFFRPEKFAIPYVSSYTPEPDMRFGILGGAFFHVAVTQALLLGYYTHDLRIWKTVNGGLVGWDIGYFYGFWNVMDAQGRLNPAGWVPDEWFLVCMTGAVMLSRLALIAEVGISRGQKGPERLKET